MKSNLSATAVYIAASLVALAAGPNYVRRVDITETPESITRADHARRLANETYPMVMTALGQDSMHAPRHFDIVFKKRIESGNVGQTRDTQIQLNAEWFRDNPFDLDMVLVHELSHVVQRYRSAPFYWTEGIADYVCYKLGYTNRWSCPQCSAEFPHYSSGYTCAGVFLLYIDQTRGADVIRQLNSELRRGSYSTNFFVQATHRSLDSLWAEFQKTPAFTPVAAQVNRLYASLGYVDGKPPADVAARIKESPGGPLVTDAGEYLKNLLNQHRLPGLSATHHGELSAAVDPVELLRLGGTTNYPRSCRIDCRETAELSTLHYLVVNHAPGLSWSLEKAWKTSPDGRVIAEYPLEGNPPGKK